MFLISNLIHRDVMELRRDDKVNMRGKEPNAQCEVGVSNRKSSCDHVVYSPCSGRLRMNYVTDNNGQDDGITGQPISGDSWPEECKDFLKDHG